MHCPMGSVNFVSLCRVTAKIPSPGEGAPAIKSDPMAVTLRERERQAVDIKLTVPKSE